MERSVLEEEGREIAEKLGNGVTCIGPWFFDEKEKEFVWHTFNDDRAFTGTTFTGKNLEEAKQNLIDSRKRFGAKPPIF